MRKLRLLACAFDWRLTCYAVCVSTALHCCRIICFIYFIEDGNTDLYIEPILKVIIFICIFFRELVPQVSQIVKLILIVYGISCWYFTPVFLYYTLVRNASTVGLYIDWRLTCRSYAVATQTFLNVKFWLGTHSMLYTLFAPMLATTTGTVCVSVT